MLVAGSTSGKRRMKIIRYIDIRGAVRFGSEQPDGSVFLLSGDIFSGSRVTNEPAQILKRLAPVMPAMIWCVGLNYRHHATESGLKIPEYPVIFAKSPSAVQNPEDPIQIPGQLNTEEVDFECELAVVIGKKCKNVLRDHALQYVLGYTCANDVSARDWQIRKGGSQWCRGKTFDTFAPLGPSIVTTDEISNPNSLRIQTILNGEIMQDWNTEDMIFDVPALIEFLSASTTLLPGTVIMTGTPHGVGMARTPPVWLKSGDHISIVIDKIGALHNYVEHEFARAAGV
jgi:2-keto-4-pentenoate hydratase/2-oxohepta-3-ene-1,7-dioic acid hydratase in catechol pathway